MAITRRTKHLIKRRALILEALVETHLSSYSKRDLKQFPKFRPRLRSLMMIMLMNMLMIMAMNMLMIMLMNMLMNILMIMLMIM